MQAAFETKDLNLPALDVDTTGKHVKIAIAELESIDSDNDLFAPTAFDKTIKEMGPSGANVIYHLIDHDPSIRSSLGKFSEIYREKNYIVGISKFKDTALWRDVVWPMYESGDISQHSVGYKAMKTERSTKNSSTPYRFITEAKLREGSSVLWGANAFTPTLDVVKSMDKAGRLDFAVKWVARLDRLTRAIKSGRFEEDPGLLLLEISQAQQAFVALSDDSTEPPQESTQPEDVKAMALEIGSHIKELFKIS